MRESKSDCTWAWGFNFLYLFLIYSLAVSCIYRSNLVIIIPQYLSLCSLFFHWNSSSFQNLPSPPPFMYSFRVWPAEVNWFSFWCDKKKHGVYTYLAMLKIIKTYTWNVWVMWYLKCISKSLYKNNINNYALVTYFCGVVLWGILILILSLASAVILSLSFVI